MLQKNANRIRMKSKGVLKILSIIIVVIDMKFMINVLLNKKYIVDDFSDINKNDALVSVQEIIKTDYKYMFYIALLNIILIIIFVIHLSLKATASSIKLS